MNAFAVLFRRFLLPVFMLLTLALGVGLSAMADDATESVLENRQPLPDSRQSVFGQPLAPIRNSAQAEYDVTLQQLGARNAINLRGVDGSEGVYFNVRADEVARSAQLDLGYAYSPSLITDLSHIRVLINDTVAATIPVPKDEAGRYLQRDILLPPHLITEFNQLKFQLIGHYTLECEDPLHSSLWANINNKSVLELTVDKLPLPNDLSIFPVPFFDFRDARRLNLPFVFPASPDAATTEAAGVLASWFGAKAGYRGASFPVSVNGLYPSKGSAIVWLAGEGAAEAHLGQKVSGPSLAVVTNPNDPFGKLLLVMGRDGRELKIAAQALVLGDEALSGSFAVVSRLEELKPRKPYDAPRWLRTDRPIKFGELVLEKDLDVFGYSAGPVRIPMTPPPDLFGWREKPVPVELGYRYTPQAGPANSSLLIRAGDQFLKSYPLLSLSQLEEYATWIDKNVLRKLQPGDMLPIKTRFDIPLARLLTREPLEFRYMYDYIKEGHCRDAIIDNVRGHIDDQSTLDLSAYPHFMLMPNLDAFDRTGFPYTRMADLSETTVVFSDQPTSQDFSTYLTLLGRFGNSTGYPATAVSVAHGMSPAALEDRDLIVISTGNQQWLSRWSDAMPVAQDGTAKQFTVSDLVYKPFEWPGPDPRVTQERPRSELQYVSDGFDVVFAGFESPLSAKRSVVLIASGKPEGQALAAKALLRDPGYEMGMQGSLAVVHGGQIKPLVAEYTYSVGKLGFWKALEWKLVQYWPGMPPLKWLLIVVAVLLGLLILSFLWRMLRRRRNR